MKLNELHLLAFGHFTDVKLDLGGGEEGFHIIVGDNEAGKSTALDAIRNLLYGIDPRSRYDFVHKYSKMRVGATLRNGDGALIRCVRRKGNKDTLRDGDDREALDESVLSSLLGGIDAALFSTLFGLNHVTLTEGGREILEGDGDLGQLLFAAGSGLTHLRGALSSLENEARDLYVERAQNPVINRGLRDLQDCERAVRESAVPADDWRKATAELAAVRKRLSEVGKALDEKTEESNRLERIARARPLSVQYQELVVELDALDEIVVLPVDFGERRVQIVQTLQQNEEKERQLGESLRKLEEDMAAVQIPTSLLEHAETIEALRDLLPRQREIEETLPALRARALHLEERSGEIRKSLGIAAEAGRSPGALLTVAERAEIRTLSRAFEKLRDRLEETQGRNAETKLAELRAMCERLPPRRDPGLLKARLKAARELGGLETQARELRAEAGALGEKGALLLGRLPEWKGSLEQFEALAVPESDVVRGAERSLTSSREEIDRLEKRSKELEREIDRLESEQRELEGGDPPPEAKTLKEARRVRDRGWKIVRESLEGKVVDRRRIRRFAEDASSDEELAGAFEQSLRHADEIADRLRDESDRIAALRSLREALAGRHRESDATVEDLKGARKRKRAEERRWKELCSKTGISARSPAAVQAWLERRGDILELRARERQLRSRLEAIEGAIEEGRKELHEGLADLGVESEEQETSLNALLSLCEGTVERVEEVERERRQLDEAMEETERAVVEARREERAAGNEWESWKARWGASIDSLGLTAEATPEQVDEVLAQVDALTEVREEARNVRREIDGSEADRQGFCDRVDSLLAGLETELAASGAIARAGELSVLLEQARRDENRKQLLEEQGEEKLAELEICRAALDAARAHSRALCEEAGREDAMELLAAERASTRKREYLDEIERVQKSLRELSAGDSLAAFLAAVRGEEQDRLPRKREALTREIEELNESEAALRENLGRLRESLERLRESAQAAEAARASEQAASLRAGLRPKVDRYVQLRLASEILRRTIDRYRRKNQGPIISRASAHFAHLTGGSFAGLEQDLDENGRAILQGFRPDPDGARILVKHMSSGTRDQLFLALRLASIERYLDSHPAVPFILDDILINFDDPRSSATLVGLAELSRRTQVIFFTHHRHLVSLARSAVPEEMLFVHELAGSLG